MYIYEDAQESLGKLFLECAYENKYDVNHIYKCLKEHDTYDIYLFYGQCIRKAFLLS